MTITTERRSVCSLFLHPMPLAIPARDYLAGGAQFCEKCRGLVK